MTSYNVQFTPAFKGVGGDPSVTYTVQEGRIVREGDIIHVYGRIEWSATTGGTGILYIECPVKVNCVAVGGVTTNGLDSSPGAGTVENITCVYTVGHRLEFYNTGVNASEILQVGDLQNAANYLYFSVTLVIC